MGSIDIFSIEVRVEDSGQYYHKYTNYRTQTSSGFYFPYRRLYVAREP